MAESEKGISVSVSRGVKRLLMGVLIGIVIGAAGMFFVMNYNPSDSRESDPTVVFSRLVEQNELVSVSQNYSIVDKSTDSNLTKRGLMRRRISATFSMQHLAMRIPLSLSGGEIRRAKPYESESEAPCCCDCAGRFGDCVCCLQ